MRSTAFKVQLADEAELVKGFGYEPSQRESLLELLTAVDQSATLQHKATSLDRRRFFGNNKNPCDAGGDPDTSNGDCHTTRFSALKDYYPEHLGIKRMDKQMVLGEYAVEGILNQALNNLDKDENVIAGNGGTLAKPSANDGIIAEAKLLKDAAAQLQRASVASVSILYDSVMNLTDTSSASVGKLKSNIAASYSDLMDRVKNVSARQDQRASSNAGQMVTDANKALQSSISTVQMAQAGASKTITMTVTKNDNNQASYQASMAKVTAKLSDAEDLVESTDDSLQKKTDVAAQQLANKIGDAAQSVTDSGQAKADAVATNAEGVQGSLKDQTQSQIQSAQSDWSAATQGAADKAKGLTDQAQAKVESVEASVNGMLSNASSNASELISGTQKDIAVRTSDAQSANKDASQAASSLSSSVNGAVAGVGAQQQQAIANAENSASNTKQSLSDLFKSASGGTGSTIQSLLQSLGQVQGQAQDQRTGAEAQSQQAIAEYLASIGQDGGQVAGALSSLQSSIAMGQSKASQEIAAQFAATNGQADATKNALTGKLDQMGDQLTNAENAFSKSAKGAASQLQSQLAQGASLTGAQLAQLGASDEATQAKLLESILAGNSAALGQAGDMESILKNLKSAAGTLNSGTGDASQALNAAGLGTDSAVEDLFGSLGDSDDDALAKIKAEAQAQRDAMNVFGAQFGNEQSAKMGAMWNDVAQKLKAQEAEADGNTNKAEVSEKANLDKADRLMGIAAALQGNVDSLTSEASGQQDAAQNGFASKLAQQQAKDNATIVQLQGTLNEYKGDALGSIGGYLQSLINSQHSSIDSGVDKQKSLLASLMAESAAAGADSSKLDVMVNALMKASNNAKSGIIGKVLSVLGDTESATDSFSGQIKDVTNQLGDAKQVSAKGLAELSRAIQAEVLKIPMILTSGAARLQNDFDMAASDLDNNILKLREKLATAKTDEEREEAMQGLVVLNKLQAIQQGVQEADKKLRAQIGDNANGAQIDAGNVEGAMMGILGAMNTINAEMDTSRITVESNTQAIGKQTATLVNGLNLMVNSTSDRLADQAAQSAVESRFGLNMAQARNKVRLAAATKGVNDTLNVFSKNADSVTDNESSTRGNIDSITGTTKSSGHAISSRIEDVLTQVMQSAGQVQGNATDGQNDVLTRLALVRMAMSKFLALWNEYAANMDRKLNRFHSSDAEFVAQMESDLKHKLGGTEDNVNSTSAQIASLKTQVQSSMNDEVEYENYFNVKINELKDSLRRLNDQRSARTIHANELVNEFGNFEAETASDLKENVKKLIDQFDDKISGHVSDMDQFNQAVSAAFIEKQIRDLDRQVASSLA